MRERSRRLILIFVAAGAAVFFLTWLGCQVLHGAAMPFDLSERNAIHAWASPPLTRAMIALTVLGAPMFLVPIAVLLVWRLSQAGRTPAAVVLVVAAAGSELVDEILKLVFHRARPVPFFGYAEPLTYSFPSGHSMVSACFYGTLAAIIAARTNSLGRKAAIWATAALLILAIGFSRIYLGVHYPSDVLGGYAAAAVWMAAVRAGYELWTRRAARGRR